MRNSLSSSDVPTADKLLLSQLTFCPDTSLGYAVLQHQHLQTKLYHRHIATVDYNFIFPTLKPLNQSVSLDIRKLKVFPTTAKRNGESGSACLILFLPGKKPVGEPFIDKDRIRGGAYAVCYPVAPLHTKTS